MTSVSVLGGGISGITTALLCRILGFETTLFTRDRADVLQGTHHPRFASLYPAASVIPHAATVPNPRAELRSTQRLFEVLRQSGTCGVRMQPHYEVFETPRPLPPYVPALHDLSLLPEDGSGRPGVPRRPDADAIYGWTYRVYFVEAPVYIPRLYALYEALGGIVRTQTVTRETLPDVPGDLQVNCLGDGALDLVDDPRPCEHLRGCLVHADLPRAAFHRDLQTSFSINYTPTADVYAKADGSPGGLYVYPRTDTWVLGGTKRRGRLDADGTWHAPPLPGPTRRIDGVEIPAPVVDVNAAVVASIADVDLREASLRATFGYRFARDLDGEGVRRDVTTEAGRPMVHNYGHGGAGVTLSWSSAVEVARHLIQRSGVPTPPSRPASLTPSDAGLVRNLRTEAVTQLDDTETLSVGA